MHTLHLAAIDSQRVTLGAGVPEQRTSVKPEVEGVGEAAVCVGNEVDLFEACQRRLPFLCCGGEVKVLKAGRVGEKGKV